jgi:hypothetical protein
MTPSTKLPQQVNKKEVLDNNCTMIHPTALMKIEQLEEAWTVTTVRQRHEKSQQRP